MRKILLLALLILFGFNSRASHFVGGEITWICISDPTSIDFGKYIFQLKVYRDCTGITFPTTIGATQLVDVWNNPFLTSITCTFVSTLDISCTGVPGIGGTASACYDCSNFPAGQAYGTVVEEIVYTSAPTDLGGAGAIPPVAGWHFSWNGNARNPNNNLNPAGGSSWIIRAVMYPYTTNTSVVPFIYEPAFPCFDSSPVFKEQAKSQLCIDIPFTYSHLAFDENLDSLSYHWADPLGSSQTYNPLTPNSTAIGFTAPYSVNEPLPSSTTGGGVLPLTLDDANGEISFHATQQGVFVTCIKVKSVKCNQIISEIYRDLQVVLVNCGTLPNGNQNANPIISAPVGTHIWTTTTNSAGMPSYETNVMAGEQVDFNIVATDADINSVGQQNLGLKVEGGQVAPSTFAISNSATFATFDSIPGSIKGNFSWLSTCEHMKQDSCAGAPNSVFTFNLKSWDDFCPANATTIATLTINIIPPTPDLRCLAVLQDGVDTLTSVITNYGDVKLSWYYPEGVIDTNIKYDIYYSKQMTGPFTLIDSAFYPDTTYIHHGSNANLTSSYYFLLGTESCGAIGGVSASDSSKILKTMLMDVTPIGMGNYANIIWNPLRNTGVQLNLGSTDTIYSLFYKKNLTFNPIQQLTDTFCQKDSDSCNYFPEFYVEILDQKGCASVSSVGIVHLQDTITPKMPIIKDVSVNLSGQAVISWIPSIGADYYNINQWTTSGWQTKGTTSSGLDSIFTWINSDADQKSEEFLIIAFDSCGNHVVDTNSIWEYSKHNSVFVQTELNICDKTVTIDWNSYTNWQNGVSHYRVFVEEIDTSGTITNFEYRLSNETTILQSIINSYYYTIYINAYNHDSSFIARSNTLNFVAFLPGRPSYNYIEYASINHDNSYVEINCLVDEDAVLDHYDVLRIDGSNFNDTNKIGEIPFIANPVIHYTDQTAITSNEFYYYIIYPVDTCGSVLDYITVYDSSIYMNNVSFARTMLLITETNIDYTNVNYSSIPTSHPGMNLDDIIITEVRNKVNKLMSKYPIFS